VADLAPCPLLLLIMPMSRSGSGIHLNSYMDFPLLGTSSGADIGNEEQDQIASPPLGVKLTMYRLLNIVVISAFGISKAVCTYHGQSVAPTTLELVGGTFLAVILYWLGLFEAEHPQKWPLFFHVDLAPVILRVGSVAVGLIVCVLLIKTFGPIVIAEEIHFYMWLQDAITKLFQICTLVTPVACIPAIYFYVTFLFLSVLVFATNILLSILLFSLCLAPKTQLYAAWRAMASVWRYVSQRQR